MFLEERVEQLENLATDQGRQIGLVAGGLATLTVEVRGIRQDMTDGFAHINQHLDEMSTNQQLILTILTEKLK